jgi:phosphate transport system substrate-binding protein
VRSVVGPHVEVAGVVKNTEGAVGYADIAYAVTNHIPVMAVRNAAGKYTTPGIKSITAASVATKKIGANNELHIVNPPKSAPFAYPIATYTYVIIPASTSNADPLRKFIFWALTGGQKYGVKLRYVPIPKHVLVAPRNTEEGPDLAPPLRWLLRPRGRPQLFLESSRIPE